LVKEYKELIKSSVADMKNIGGAHGGAITAALILQEFVGDTAWAHLDIAGPAFAESDNLLSPKGGTGFGVRTLIKFLMSL
jgi:leucyl aminopeptidase